MRRYVLAAATSAALTAVVLFAGPAVAQPADDPVSGDDRATARSGNVVGKDCAELFPGSSEIASGDLTFSVDATNTYIDVTAVADGVEVAGVVVKGGPAYNVYEPADLPWLDLHSPLVPSGKPAQISHWFACGITENTTTTGTTTTPGSGDTTTSAPSGSETTTRGESSPGGAVVTTTPTDTSADVSPAAEDEDLAYTGFDGGWLILLAGFLLVGGAALLVLMRLRAARR